MKAAVYLRQSVDRYGDELAVSRQREDCLKLCQERGWLPLEYVDNDKSATSGRRPAYEQMLDDIRTEAIGAVVVWDLDRLHRRPIELEHFISLADEKRLSLASVGGDADLSTDSGRLFARIKGVVARAEIERKSARQKRAARQRAEAGKPWGPRAFGYTVAGEIVEAEATALRDAYSAALVGASLYSIAMQWNKAGIKTTLGNTWTGRTLKQVIERPRYAGLRAYLGEIVGAAEWPSIVPEDLWRAVQHVLSDPSRLPRPARRKFLLTGIARCGNCGGTVASGAKRRTGRVLYVCKHCFRVARVQAEVDNWVVSCLAEALTDGNAWRALIRRDCENIAELRDQEAVLRSRLDWLAADYADGVLTSSQVRVATERIKMHMAVIESKLFDANARRVLGGVTDADDPAETFRVLPLDRKRAVVDTMVTVTIMPIGHGGSRVFDPSKVLVTARSGLCV